MADRHPRQAGGPCGGFPDLQELAEALLSYGEEVDMKRLKKHPDLYYKKLNHCIARENMRCRNYQRHEDSDDEEEDEEAVSLQQQTSRKTDQFSKSFAQPYVTVPRRGNGNRMSSSGQIGLTSSHANPANVSHAAGAASFSDSWQAHVSLNARSKATDAMFEEEARSSSNAGLFSKTNDKLLSPQRATHFCLEPVHSRSKDYSRAIDRIDGHWKTDRQDIKIERVDNEYLHHRYRAFKETLMRKYGTSDESRVERWLWHGTQSNCVEKICHGNFNRSYTVRALYGQGVYFSTSFSYSAQDLFSPRDRRGRKTLFLCRVLTGTYAQGAEGMIEPPLKRAESLSRYDSCVDNVSNPTMFVVFQDAQAYPEYLLTF